MVFFENANPQRGLGSYSFSVGKTVAKQKRERKVVKEGKKKEIRKKKEKKQKE